jgi:CHAD domain-containing protein
MAIEVERKYEVPSDLVLPDLDGLGEPAEHRLDATYFDTPSLRLARQRVTLRHRGGGTDAGWHLKRPTSSPGARSEWREPDQDDVPEPLRVAVRALSRGEPLRPVARIRTRRLERPLRADDGTVLALVADDVVHSESTVDDRLKVKEWREVEVELVRGEPDLLDAVEKTLRRAGARPSASPSKLAHALSLRSPSSRKRKERSNPLGDYIRAQRDAIVSNDPGVREGDADPVHDMRVATRRLRATLRTYRGVLPDRAGTQRLRDELKWLGEALGAVRDGDVLTERLTGAVDREPAALVVGPVRSAIRGRLGSTGTPARQRLIEVLDSERYLALLRSLDVLAEARLDRVSGNCLRRLARKAVRRADSRLVRALSLPDVPVAGVPMPGTVPADRAGALHEARKAYKRGRYAVEVLAPKRPAARKLAESLGGLQDVLGAHHDTVVAGDVLREHGMRANAAGENAFTYGLLHARQHEAGERLIRDDLPPARRRAGRGGLRRKAFGG